MPLRVFDDSGSMLVSVYGGHIYAEFFNNDVRMISYEPSPARTGT